MAERCKYRVKGERLKLKANTANGFWLSAFGLGLSALTFLLGFSL